MRSEQEIKTRVEKLAQEIESLPDLTNQEGIPISIHRQLSIAGACSYLTIEMLALSWALGQE